MQQITRWQGLKGNACYRFWLTPIQVYLELQRYLRTCSFNCSQLCLYGNNLHTLYMLASTITLMHFIFTSVSEKKNYSKVLKAQEGSTGPQPARLNNDNLSFVSHRSYRLAIKHTFQYLHFKEQRTPQIFQSDIPSATLHSEMVLITFILSMTDWMIYSTFLHTFLKMVIT